ncbi:CHAT domain-containing protein [Lentzea sp. BCCO 10_0061]|uniref:CHAT domain-containing protein n=1 Tax=Lentzea sokolovensis TaxID=3095429 RepID=A0ABU4UMI9_9PSEU|nr:CHAT domain-containing protein [Lentzea sp. BCCO 10_0061]MDX8140631.1 CHAT domain-containing protein [Lentzea sp. BCCO 10_0061]
MTSSPLTELLARLSQFVNTSDPRHVLGHEAEMTAGRLVEAHQTGGSDETATALGWFHWFRCVALLSFDGDDFHLAAEYFRPLWEQRPDAVPDKISAVLSRKLTGPELFEKAIGLGREAGELVAAYQAGDDTRLSEAIARLRLGIAILRDIGAMPEMLQVNLVHALLLQCARDRNPDSLGEAVTWASHTIDSLTSATDEQAVPLLTALGSNLVKTYRASGDHLSEHGEPLLTLAVAAWDRVQERTPTPDIRLQVRLQLAGALISSSLVTSAVGRAEQAARYIGLLVDDCNPDNSRDRDLLDSLSQILVPLEVARREPALLRARASVLRALSAHAAVSVEERLACQAELGLCLRIKHMTENDSAALDEAVEALRSALSGVPPHDLSWMVSLANALKTRAHTRIDIARGDDLSEAEQWARLAHQQKPDDATAVSCLGNVLREKALAQNDVEALRESARWNHTAARMMSSSSPVVVMSLMNAALSYQELAEATASLADCDHAIVLLRTASEHAGANHPDHAAIQVELGRSLTLRGELGEGTEVLAEGRKLLESAAVGPPGHEDTWRAKAGLIDSYRVEFVLTQHHEALDEALRLARAYMDDASMDEDARGWLLTVCGNTLVTAYTTTQNRKLLDEVLPVYRMAAQSTAAGSFTRAVTQLGMGTCLLWLYEVSRDSTALLEAIDVLGEAASNPETWRTTPEAMFRLAQARTHHVRQLKPLLGGSRKTLENSVPANGDEFSGLYADFARELDKIVDLGRRSLALCAPGSREHPAAMSYLAMALQGRGQHHSSEDDAGEAVELMREAIRIGRPDHPDWPVWHINLAATLLDLHKHGKAPLALDDGEAAGRKAMAMTSSDDALHMQAMSVLSHILVVRGREDGLGFAEALELQQQIYRASHVDLAQRIRAATAAGELAASEDDWTGALEHYEAAVDLLPQLVGHRLGRSDKEFLLAEQIPFASEAAACALRLGDPHKALELLERGRGILLGQLTETRRDLSDLLSQRPDLGEEFAQLGEKMTVLGASVGPVSAEARGSAGDEHRRIVREWERVRDEVRAMPGFESFLRPRVPDLDRLTENRLVVVVNVATRQSDAVILADGRTTCLPLPEADYLSVARRFKDFTSAVGRLHDPYGSAETRWEAGTVILDTLGWLWTAIAQPVLASLGAELGGDTPPRLWWCPTGLLSFLPLHAAGDYTAVPAQGVGDHVMSSYTTTLNTLSATDIPAPSSHRASPDPRLLVVATPQAPGTLPLRHSTADARALTDLFPRTKVLAGEAATKAGVLRELAAHDWAHFACHTRSDPFGRTASELVLQDGTLSLPDISALSLDAELVFLASCGSAAGAFYLADEAHHVASSFQLAGFTHVIATLWEIADGDATQFTATLYGLLAMGMPPHEAIHRVTRDLRACYPRSPWLWAPYVHMGP